MTDYALNVFCEQQEQRLRRELASARPIQLMSERWAEHWHGTVSGYNWHKCRCELCAAAKRANGKAYKLKVRSARRAARRHYFAQAGLTLGRAVPSTPDGKLFGKAAGITPRSAPDTTEQDHGAPGR